MEQTRRKQHFCFHSLHYKPLAHCILNHLKSLREQMMITQFTIGKEQMVRLHSLIWDKALFLCAQNFVLEFKIISCSVYTFAHKFANFGHNSSCLFIVYIFASKSFFLSVPTVLRQFNVSGRGALWAKWWGLGPMILPGELGHLAVPFNCLA